ncbi:MAG: chloride channel protein [Nitrospinota bacterium]
MATRPEILAAELWKSLLKWLKEKSGRNVITERTLLIAVAAGIGVLGGLGAVVFRLLIGFFQGYFLGYKGGDLLAHLLALPWYQRLLAPAAGGLLVGPMVYFLAREAKGHGVPEVMEAVALKGGTIRPRVAVVKSLASSLCIASGGSVGREGPIVQIGSAIGSTVGQIFRASSAKKRLFVGCGAAAGIAGTFNTPIAGALFSLEVILGDFGIMTFSPLVVSSVAAVVVSRHFLGDSPAFVVPPYALVSVYEFIPYTLLGILAGVLSIAYTKAVYFAEDSFETLPKVPPYLLACAGGLGVGLLGVFAPHVFGVGYETTERALAGNLAWYLLFLLPLVKILATSITLGSGGSGGIFAPSLFIGAGLGGSLGKAWAALFPAMGAPSGAYAMVGMGAIVAGATHAPITAVVIVFEMTSDYSIILPLMVACTISTVIACSLQSESIYTLKLTRRGVSLFRGKELNLMRRIFVRDALREEIVTIQKDTYLKDILGMTADSDQAYYPVVDEKGEITGILSIRDVMEGLRRGESRDQQLRAGDVSHKKVVFLSPEEDFEQAFKKYQSLHVEELPVVSPHNPKVPIGIAHVSDLMAVYRRQVLRQSEP